MADLRHQIADGLTTSDVDAVLASASVPAEDRSALVRLLQSIESAEYGAAQSIDALAAVEQASSLIARISPYLEQKV